MIAPVCRSQVESITIDSSLIFTRYLDSMLFTEHDLQTILQRRVMNGRLGRFIVGRNSYIHEDFSVESGKISARSSSLISEFLPREAAMLARSGDRNFVCPSVPVSVRPSHACFDTK